MKIILISWAVWASAALWGVAAAAPAAAAEGTTVFSLQCSPFYLPARSIWQRTVTIEMQTGDIRAVQIDGVAVYAFSVNGTTLLTSVDGERIQIDIEGISWRSDLRGIVSSSGACTR